MSTDLLWLGQTETWAVAAVAANSVPKPASEPRSVKIVRIFDIPLSCVSWFSLSLRLTLTSLTFQSNFPLQSYYPQSDFTPLFTQLYLSALVWLFSPQSHFTEGFGFREEILDKTPKIEFIPFKRAYYKTGQEMSNNVFRLGSDANNVSEMLVRLSGLRVSWSQTERILSQTGRILSHTGVKMSGIWVRLESDWSLTGRNVSQTYESDWVVCDLDNAKR
jgi:hypothetical protein